MHKAKLTPILKGKPVRTASGIAVVAVMCKPHRCPHIAVTGNICIYCPGGPDSDFEYSTQSYTGYEPTSMRAIRARYNPYLQTRDRIEQLKRLGCSCDWERERFTMDEDYSAEVTKTFVHFFESGHIHRGKRMVNWCPATHTAISDEEVNMKPQNGFLYKMRYA